MKARRPWLAALLGFFAGPVGNIYAGRFQRGLFLWLLLGIVAPIIAAGVIRITSGPPTLVFIVIVCLGLPSAYAWDALRNARRASSDRKWYQRWWIYILFFLATVLVNVTVADQIRDKLLEAFEVPSRGMSPAILAGDRILVDKTATINSLARNDVIVFYSSGPGTPVFVMRVVGLPGEVVEIRGERALIDGDERGDQNAFVNLTRPAQPKLVNQPPITIPQGHVYVLGDNRRNARDSRSFGPIPVEHFYGMAHTIYFSREVSPLNPNSPIKGRFRWERFGKSLRAEHE